MDESRRDFIKAAALGVLLPSAVKAAPGPIPNTAAGSLRLITFAPDPRSAPRVGVVGPSGHIVDIGQAAKAQGAHLSFDPSQMVSLIAGGAHSLAELRHVVAKAAADGPAIDQVRLLAPIPIPTRNVYAVGWNYLDHFKEGAAMRVKEADLPEHPVFFTKAVHAVNGPFDPIPFDANVSDKIDWEGELAVIIGKKGRNIAEAEAMDYVFGYSVINDTTARDIQQKKHGGQWFKGKSLDGHGPFGPWIIPAAELDPAKLHLITRVNGVIKQDASTEQMYFKVPRIISELSLGMTLEPGDIIATGTPPGVGGARNPPEYLKPGDVLETEIVEIGVIRNIITQV